MELKISNLPSEAVKKLKSGKEIQIVLTGEVCGIKIENNFSIHSGFCTGTETTIFFEEQDIEIKERESIEIPETYAECQDYYNRSLKTCSNCALKSQHGCGRIRENIMKFYHTRI
jgi:hypothetical protein